MKKHMLLISNMIIIIAIVAGFSAIVYKDTRSYQDLAENQLESVVNLADINISKQIDSSMSKPVMVSKTMANDEFLKAWLLDEPKNSGNSAYLNELYNYLKAYQAKYSYTTIFCVSAQSGNYYYQGGFNKTLSEKDAHDIWYYNFLGSGKEYDLEVDTNEADNNDVTLFINFRVEGSDGKLFGVIGVGLKINLIEDTIHSYTQNYGLSVYIINHGGSENSFSGNTDTFINEKDLSERTGIKEHIVLNKSEKSEIQWFTSGNERKCLITKYNDTLGWFLVLEMKTDSISSVFQDRITQNILFMLISLAACIVVTTAVFLNYNQRMLRIANTDDLTGLYNRKMFLKQYNAFVRKHRAQRSTLFMLDIDHFKQVNDTYGHIFGNAVLAMVGEKLQSAIGEYGLASRWGGDEFLGIMPVGQAEALERLSKLMDSLKTADRESPHCVTVSIGIAEISGKSTSEQMIKKVDEALYKSKKNGRNRITIAE